MRVKVEVNNDDIRQGRQYSCRLCPVARASKRALTAASGLAKLVVEVDGSFIEAYTKERYGLLPSYSNTILTAGVPRKVRNFISKFDGGEAVKPFSFYLNV